MASAACCKPAPAAVHLCEGKDGSIGGLPAYLNKHPSATTAIIFLSDVFGYDAPALRKLADKVAAEGYFSIVPDFFKGDPFVPADVANPFANFGPWIAVHTPDASVDVSKTIIKELKDQGITKIGCSGFCWGGRLAVLLAKKDAVTDCIVCLHPSIVGPDDIKDVTVPIAILASEIDEFTTAEVLEQFKAILKEKSEVKSFVKVYAGQEHGWTIRYDVNNSFQVKGAEEAHADMLAFYKNNL